MENVDIKDMFTAEEVKANPKGNDRKLKLAQKTFASAKRWFNRKRKAIVEAKINQTENSFQNKMFASHNEASKFITRKTIKLEKLRDKLNLLENANYTSSVPAERRAIKLKEQMLLNVRHNGTAYVIESNALNNILDEPITINAKEDVIDKNSISEELKKAVNEKIEEKTIEETKEEQPIEPSKISEAIEKALNEENKFVPEENKEQIAIEEPELPQPIAEVAKSFEMPEPLKDGDDIHEYEKYVNKFKEEHEEKKFGVFEDGTYRLKKEDIINHDPSTIDFDYENHDDEFNYSKDVAPSIEQPKTVVGPQNFDANPINVKINTENKEMDNVRELPAVVPERQEIVIKEDSRAITSSVNDFEAMKSTLLNEAAKKRETEEKLRKLKEEAAEKVSQADKVINERVAQIIAERKAREEELKATEDKTKEELKAREDLLKMINGESEENNYEEEKGKQR